MNLPLLRARAGGRHEKDERHAVIDIGSNTVRLVVYGGPPRAPAVLWNEKVSARLGRDLSISGDIPAEAMEEALAALARFAVLLSGLGIARVDTVATAAAREAGNGPEFVARVEALGLGVRVLSGEEEARASALGTIGAFPGARGVVADLGGGSLELVAVENGVCGEAASFPLGTLRLPAMRAKGRFGPKAARILREAKWARGAETLYMVGGTWRAFAAQAMRSADHPLTDPHGLRLSADEAARLAQTLSRADPARVAELPGISRMRAEKLPDAAALLRVLLRELKPDALVFSSWGLREGLWFEALPAPDRGKDPLLEGIAHFAAQAGACGADACAIARWTAPLASAGDDHAARLPLAAAHLALALHCVEPNLRAAQALEWALDKRWIGIDFTGRALLAAALRGSLGLTAPHPRLETLAGAQALDSAVAWGLGVRLAHRLGAGSSRVLAASRLMVGPQEVALEIAKPFAALATGPAEKDLGALARWLGAAPCLTIGG